MLASHVALGDVFKITSGGTPSRREPAYFEGGNIPWVKTGDLKEKYIFDAEEKITELAVSNSSAKVFPAGTVLLAMYGATIGACAILKTEAATNQACAAFLPVSNVDSEYLYYYLRSQKASFVRDGVGGAQPNISGTYLKRVTIPLPPLATQKHIARVLEKADQLRKQAQQMENEFNQLAQSLFLEMFGDPATNEKLWPQFSLAQLTTKIGSGSTPTGGKEAYQDIGISLIRSLNVHDGEFLYKNLARIDDQQANALSNVVVEPQDVLLNITGASVCRCCVVPSDVLPARVNQHVAILRPDGKKLTTAYLQALIVSPSFKASLLRLAGAGATREALTKGTLEDLQIPTPPLDKQIAFENAMNGITKQIEAIKVKQRQLASLFESLMQRAFNGELTTPERKAA